MMTVDTILIHYCREWNLGIVFYLASWLFYLVYKLQQTSVTWFHQLDTQYFLSTLSLFLHLFLAFSSSRLINFSLVHASNNLSAF